MLNNKKISRKISVITFFWLDFKADNYTYLFFNLLVYCKPLECKQKQKKQNPADVVEKSGSEYYCSSKGHLWARTASEVKCSTYSCETF